MTSNMFDALRNDGESEGCDYVDDTDEVTIAGPGEHRLQFNYSLWLSRKSPGKHTANTSYDQNLQKLATFASVEQFWAVYSHLARPSAMSGHCDYHLFKEGIRPMWEDDANKMGGKWMIRLKKGLASRCWENLIMAMIGEQFMVGEEICGAVISVRYQEDILSLWNRSAGDTQTNVRIQDILRRVLNLPPNTIMEYKTHNDSLKSLVVLADCCSAVENLKVPTAKQPLMYITLSPETQNTDYKRQLKLPKYGRLLEVTKMYEPKTFHPKFGRSRIS